jgi:hypothetical protein
VLRPFINQNSCIFNFGDCAMAMALGPFPLYAYFAIKLNTLNNSDVAQHTSFWTCLLISVTLDLSFPASSNGVLGNFASFLAWDSTTLWLWSCLVWDWVLSTADSTKISPLA